MAFRAAIAFAVVMVAVMGALGDDEWTFNAFIKTYGRQYVGEERARRLECFTANLRLIDERNARDKHATHAVNKFTDLCADEMHKLTSGAKPIWESNAMKAIAPLAKVEARNCTAVNWLTQGAVTPIGDEGQCGSCWAFSVNANIEGILAVAGYPLIALSEQELLACTSAIGDMGCEGGYFNQTYQWIIDNGGLNSAKNYPYTSGNGNTGNCDRKKEKTIVASIGGYVGLPQDEASIASYVCEHGPVNMAVDASTWTTYTGGIMTSCQSNSVDHSATIIGFNLNNNPPYWIVKNSWGTSWGEQGYARLEYGVNLCGINSQVTSATPPKK